VFQKEQPEIVFHLAAQPIVRLSYKEPTKTYETNLMGAVNLLEAVRLTNSVKVVVVITSDKCYENKEWVWGYRETDELGGHDPYSSSKACVEIITASYRRSYFNSSERKIYLATARAGNVIGGGDWSEDRIVPDLIKAIDRNETLELRNPKAVRPWQHVLEPLAGYLKLAALLTAGPDAYEGAWNFGPMSAEVISVEELIQHARSCWGNDLNYQINSTWNSWHETHYLQLDSSKAFRLLNWKTILNPYQAVELTIDWYKAYYQSGSAAYELCLEQIKNYTALVQARNY
jgi:CDP-glucose 4,6-dehydratase